MENYQNQDVSGDGLPELSGYGSKSSISPDLKTYYVIAYNGGGGGLFAIYYQVLWQIVYALENGYVPVVDLKHYYNQYFKDNRTYKDNAWEYFFKQPCNVRLDDLKNKCNIIISKDSNLLSVLSFNSFLKDIKKSREIYKKYFGVIKFQDDIQNFIEEASRRIIGENYSDVLGILCRGTDYTNVHPYAHPVQPKVEKVIKKAKELQKRFNYKRIWLSTEDKSIYSQFKKEFGDMLIDNPYQYRFGDTGSDWLVDVVVERKDHAYNLAKGYLLSIYVLSKCPYIIGGRTAGTVGCWLLSYGFEHQKYVYIWNLGLYNCFTRKIKYNNFFERIFSIKFNSRQNWRYILITILGLLIKIPVLRVESYDKEYCNLNN